MKRLISGFATSLLTMGMLVAVPAAAGAVSNSATDPTGDVPNENATFDITSLGVSLTSSTVQVTVTTAAALPPLSDASWLRGSAANSGRLISVGLGTNLGDESLYLDGDGIAVNGRDGDVTDNCTGASGTVSGSTATLTAPASCLRYPGSVAAAAFLSNGFSARNGHYDVAIAPNLNKDLADTTVDDLNSVTPVKAALPGGYYQLGADGGVFSFGDAQFYGSTGSLKLNSRVVAMSSQLSGAGYRFVAGDGGVFDYGDAQFYGSMGGKPLNKPIVGMSTTATGKGYWLVASDGGIFAYGDAQFYGSMGGKPLNKPIVAMAPTSTGHGYWMVASDGGIFAFGDARFYGSAGSIKLSSPIVGMAAAPDGNGYWLAAKDGGVFAYGSSQFKGSGVDDFAGSDVVSIGTNASGSGYYLSSSDGLVYNYGNLLDFGDINRLLSTSPTDSQLNSPIVGLAVKP